MCTFRALPETMTRALRTAPLSLLCLSACRPTDHVPAYLAIDNAVVSANAMEEGSSSSKITDAWVFVNDQSTGVWEVPSKIPVLAAGTSNLKVIAGIARNGILADRVQYPFYDTWTNDLILVPEGRTEIEPVFTYFNGLWFWIEDFDDIGNTFNVEDQSDTTLVRISSTISPDLVLEGDGSGAIFLDTAHTFIRIVTDEDFNPGSLVPVFMELDYRCDHRFLIGTYHTLSGTVTRTPLLFVAPTKRPDGGMPWNKIYVDLSALLSITGATDREVYVEAQLDAGTTSAQIYLDNVKLIHQ